MANGNGPTDREWGELRSDMSHVVEILARMEVKQDVDHDVCQDYKVWKPEHEAAHKRERGILAGLSVIGTAAASVLAWFK